MSGRGAEPLEELRIRYRPVGRDRYFVLANGPASAADVIDWNRPVDFVAELDKLFEEAFGEQPRQPDEAIDTRLTELGRKLFEGLIPQPVRDCLETSIGIAQAEGCKLRVRFDLPAELSDLPVEILCPPREDRLGGPLALNGNLSVVRSVPGRRQNSRLPKPEDDERPLSILVVVASPDDRPPLDVGAELERLEGDLSRFRGAMDAVVFDFLGRPKTDEPATLSRLHNKVRRRSGNPLAVLLIAHGEISPDRGQAQVVLESENRSAQPVSAGHIATAIGGSPRVRFVALNLCVGARIVGHEPLSGVAQAIISNGVPAVVGMSTPVSDQAGAHFSAPLFEALCRNEFIDDALQAARAEMSAIEADTRIEWCAPVLCMEEGCFRGRLFKVKHLMGEHLEPQVDPRLEGQSAGERLSKKGRADYLDLVPAAQFDRSIGNWARVRDRATMGREQCENDRHRSLFERFEREARVELAVADPIDKLCEELASGAPPARPTLPGVPSAIADCLFQEVARAGELHRHRERAGAAERTGDWEAALDAWAAVLEIDPNDPTAQSRHEQCRARLYDGGWAAFKTGDWREAIATFMVILRQARVAQPANVGDHVENEAWNVAAEAFALLTEQGAPGDPRRDYCLGRLAEIEGRWADARAAYERVGEGLPDADAHLRGAYADGRACEDCNEWSKAADAYAALPAGYADRDQRLPYARGRASELAAFGTGDWSKVVEELHPLEDRYRDVAHRRGYARARVAEAEDDWASVLSSLTDLDDGLHDGDLGRLRTYAGARQAEDQDDWARAAERYRELSDGERDVAARRPYAVARGAEQDVDWEAAVRAYEAIPEHEHTAGRLPYVRARLSESKGDWRAVVEALTDQGQVAEDLREAVHLLAVYARGRVEEDAHQWSEAATTYQGCASFRDATARAKYVVGREREDDGEWAEAITIYQPIADRLTDAAERAGRLKGLRRALPWLDGLPHAGLVEDPLGSVRGASPYQTLRKSGITPRSTVQEVRDGSYVLMARGWTSEVRSAWDRLRTVSERLQDDACLYRLMNPADLARAQRNLAPGEPAPLLARLRDELEPDAPLFSLLSGDRAEAIAEWEARLRQDLANSGVAHALALACTGEAVDLGNNGLHEDAAASWERAIAYWGRVLTADAYWDSWRAERALCYQYTVFAGDLTQARRALAESLSARLADLADQSQREGRAEDAERYRRLALALAVELAAAKALGETGGIPGTEASTTLAGGPLFVRLHPSLREPLAHLVVRLDAEEGRAETSARLRGVFSELGAAIVLLDQEQPSRALEALRGLHQDTLSELPTDCDHARDGLIVEECPDCADFLDRNPGHAGLRHRRTRLLLDAVDLATRALLALAQAALAEGRQGHTTALGRMGAAIDVAENVGAQVRTRHAIVRVVLGRAHVLLEEGWGQRLTGERLTEAIDLVGEVRELVGQADDGQLEAKEAELLVARGIWYGLSCYEYEEPSPERAEADLRRALALNEESLDAREHLAGALMAQELTLRLGANDSPRPHLLREALSTLDDGLQKTSNYVPFHAMLAEALNALEQLCFDMLSPEELEMRLRASAPEATSAQALIDQANRELEAHPVAGLLTLIALVRMDARNVEWRQRLLAGFARVSGWEERG